MIAAMVLFLFAAFVFSLKRLFYAWAFFRPQQVQLLAQSRMLQPYGLDPVRIVEFSFYLFHTLQAFVIIYWCYHFSGSLLPDLGKSPVFFVLAIIALFIGIVLNAGVFLQLGRRGVFYGNRFGHDIPFCTGFPFSIVRHPQYFGSVLVLWSIFFIMRFPNEDWWWIPAFETASYILGSKLEEVGLDYNHQGQQ